MEISNEFLRCVLDFAKRQKCTHMSVSQYGGKLDIRVYVAGSFAMTFTYGRPKCMTRRWVYFDAKSLIAVFKAAATGDRMTTTTHISCTPNDGLVVNGTYAFPGLKEDTVQPIATVNRGHTLMVKPEGFYDAASWALDVISDGAALCMTSPDHPHVIMPAHGVVRHGKFWCLSVPLAAIQKTGTLYGRKNVIIKMSHTINSMCVIQALRCGYQFMFETGV